MNDKEKIEDCYRQMYHGMVEKDRDVLSDVLDGSFVLVHMTGMRQDKDTFIRAIEDGTLNYYSANHHRMDVKIQSDYAEMIGQSVVRAAVFGGMQNTWHLQLKMKLTQNDGIWKITEAKASMY